MCLISPNDFKNFGTRLGDVAYSSDAREAFDPFGSEDIPMKVTKRTIALALAASALVAAPVAAQATERASAPTSDESELFGGSAWIGIIATIAVVILAVVAATRDHNNSVSA